VRRYAFLAVEDLEIRNMLRRANPVADPANPGQFLPNGAAAKRGLNRSIADASWGQFVSILRAKGEDAGRVLVDVDPPHTSTESRPQLTHTALMPSSRAPKIRVMCRGATLRARAIPPPPGRPMQVALYSRSTRRQLGRPRAGQQPAAACSGLLLDPVCRLGSLLGGSLAS